MEKHKLRNMFIRIECKTFENKWLGYLKISKTNGLCILYLNIHLSILVSKYENYLFCTTLYINIQRNTQLMSL